jgi:hypothetical protein
MDLAGLESAAGICFKSDGHLAFIKLRDASTWLSTENNYRLLRC